MLSTCRHVDKGTNRVLIVHQISTESSAVSGLLCRNPSDICGQIYVPASDADSFSTADDPHRRYSHLIRTPVIPHCVGQVLSWQPLPALRFLGRVAFSSVRTTLILNLLRSIRIAEDRLWSNHIPRYLSRPLACVRKALDVVVWGNVEPPFFCNLEPVKRILER